MDKEGLDKVRAILSKFRRESKVFNINKKILLTKIWIDILLKAEEYEMAWALQNEKADLIKKRSWERRKKNFIGRILKYYFLILKRKLK